MNEWLTVHFWVYLVMFLFVLYRAIVMTYQEHLGVTYITLNEDSCPRMLIHNKCPVPLLFKENVKGSKDYFNGHPNQGLPF